MQPKRSNRIKKIVLRNLIHLHSYWLRNINVIRIIIGDFFILSHYGFFMSLILLQMDMNLLIIDF